MQTNYTGKRVIVRAYGAGVFYGTFVEKEGQTVVLKDARRVYYWSGASDCNELAEAGCDKDSKLTRACAEVMIEQVLEVHPCSDAAILNLDSIKEWKYR